MESLHVNATQIRNKWDWRKSSAQSERRDICGIVMRNIPDLLSDAKTLYERRFGMPFNGPVIPFGAMVEYHPISAKDTSRLHQFGPKVLPGIFLGYVFFAVRIWKGDIMVADIVKNWRRWKHQKCMPEGSMQRKC